jgi:putative ABC transport system permease protein
VIRITLRDLQWRRRRFIIAAAGTSLVFALTLVLAGISNSFRVEAANSIAVFGADEFVVKVGVAGPFTPAAFPAGMAPAVARIPGVSRADPVVVGRVLYRATNPSDVVVVGHGVGGLGTPSLSSGRAVATSGEAVVDDSLGVATGAVAHLGDRDFKVVGTTHGQTAFGGQPEAYMLLGDAQALSLGAAPVITALAVRGHAAQVPAGLQVVDLAASRADLMRPLKHAIGTIDMIEYLLWAVAASIIGSVVYLSAMERVRDFAVLKATGSSSTALLMGVASQSVLLALTSAVLSVLLAVVLARSMPMAVVMPATAFAALPAVAALVGLLASVSGVRRALAVDPALAFGGP